MFDFLAMSILGPGVFLLWRYGYGRTGQVSLDSYTLVARCDDKISPFHFLFAAVKDPGTVHGLSETLSGQMFHLKYCLSLSRFMSVLLFLVTATENFPGRHRYLCCM